MKTNKNAHNYKNLHCIPTWKLEAILESPNCTGIDGRDYGPVRDELEGILFERKNRLQAYELRKAMARMNKAPAPKTPAKLKNPIISKVWAKVSEAMALEGVTGEEEFFINDNGFSMVAIPPVIVEAF